jgi:MFS family permease
MAQLSDVSAPSTKLQDIKVISLVGLAHFMSHIYVIMLPPLFIFARAEYDVSFVQLGFVMAVFGFFSASLQTPAGYVVDRLDAGTILIIGLVLSATGCVVIGLVPAFWALLLGYALLGLANTIYHPADYAILSHGISAPRMANAYSIHTFLGMAGQAVTPAFMLAMAGLWGWRSGFLTIAVVTYAVAIILLLQKDVLSEPTNSQPRKGEPAQQQAGGWKILMTGPIIKSFVFFCFLTMTGGALQNFSVVGFGALQHTEIATANWALTAYLVFSALGVLLGGVIASRLKNPMLIATLALAGSGLTILLMALIDTGPVLLITLMTLAGILSGIIMPSRDMIVRAVTPPGSFGLVFGFVSTGFAVAAMIAPPLYGWLMDLGQPRTIFLCAAGFTLLSVLMANSAKAKKTATPEQHSA